MFPPLCALCGGDDPGDGLGCDEHRLPLRPSGPRCGRCAAALPPAIRDWILALKHGRRSDLARTLGRALGARFAEDRDPQAAARLGPPILVPVPLHWTRRLDRGYDQARLVAEAAATVEGLEVVRALSRSRPTAVQGSIGAPSRSANVARAFRPRRLVSRDHRKVAGRDAWIVDDVVTSGATASECARALKRLGAARVGLLALARA